MLATIIRILLVYTDAYTDMHNISYLFVARTRGKNNREGGKNPFGYRYSTGACMIAQELTIFPQTPTSLVSSRKVPIKYSAWPLPSLSGNILPPPAGITTHCMPYHIMPATQLPISYLPAGKKANARNTTALYPAARLAGRWDGDVG